jgi:hypothetical protein
MISLTTPRDVQTALADQLKSLRKKKGHSRSEAAHHSGVPAPTLRRFEETGEISLRQFLMLCAVYGELDAASRMLPDPVASTMDELIAEAGRQS